MTSVPLLRPCHHNCSLRCSRECAQHQVNRQALADMHISLGVLFGLKQIYHLEGLPPCIQGSVMDLGEPEVVNVAA